MQMYDKPDETSAEDAGSVNGAAGAARVKPIEETVRVVANSPMAPGIQMVVLSSPRIAETIEPGQFVHMRIPGMEGHILRRPFSVCSWDHELMRILYQVVGYGTSRMSELAPGALASLVGPVGHGWNPPEGVRHAVLVCGGMGLAPQYMLARQLVDAGVLVDCIVGATTASRLVLAPTTNPELFGARLHVCTDDGSDGHHGFCTDLIPEVAQDADYISICGPEGMERAAVKAANELGPLDDGRPRTVEVSLERRMACGIGACLSCAVDTVEGRKRACVDGPVFRAEEVVWR